MIRLFDISIAVIAIILFSPLILVCSILIFIFDGWPIFFFQKRVGNNFKLFSIIKFRTMISKPKENEKWSLRTQTKDPRITKFGRILRTTSIDELPQLFNVLMGDMSLVGPRPDTPMQESDYSHEQWKLRCSVRPGITGLAQINGRSNIDLYDKIQLDLIWVEKKSFLLYLKIIILTPFKIFVNSN